MWNQHSQILMFLYFPFCILASDQNYDMKLVSWNVNGIRATIKKGFKEILEDINPDIIGLQETKANIDQTREALQNIDGYHVFINDSKARKGYSGTAILTKEKPNNVSYDIMVNEHDSEGRVITAEYPDFYLVNVYVPNSGSELRRLDYRSTWDEAFTNYLFNLGKVKKVIVTGDFNVAHQPIDLARPESNYNKSSGYTQVEIDGFKNLLQKNAFVDTFRHLHPEKETYSYWNQRFRARDRNIGWRIDYFLVPQQMMLSVKSAFILNEVHGSDHCPVGIEI